MKVSKGINPVMRAVGVFSAVAIIAGGATYAALSSTATLSDNTLSTADASLKIYNFDTGAFESDAPGFTVDNLVPGAYSEKNFFYLLNDGEADLDVTVSANDDVDFGAGTVTASDVTLKFTSGECSDVVTKTLAELQTAPVELPCNSLSQGAQGNASPEAEATEGNYSVEFKVETAGEELELTNLNLSFTGTVTSDSVESDV